MGGTGSSLFYPDNPKRRDRAEQLKTDCETAQRDYQSARKSIADLLEPLHGQLDEVLKALGCNTLAELDQKVLDTATGDALEDWKKVRNAYDTADKVEGVIFAACGIIAAAGFVISVVMGVFSFGIGFVAGIELTMGITAILGVIGLIFDAINGAIQREKLREAINKLFVTRNQIRQVADQTYAMQDVVPTITKLYEAVIKGGITDKETIKQILVSQGSTITDNGWSYYRTAKSLNDMDKSRSSWTNEDPNWESVANELDASHKVTASFASFSAIAPNAALGQPAALSRAAAPTESLDQYEITSAVPRDLLHDADIKVILSPINSTASGDVPYFDKPVLLHMLRIVSEETAVVQLEGPEFETIKNKFVVELLGSQQSDDNANTSAEVLLLNPDMIAQCLLPNGEYGTDKQLGRLRATYV